MLRCTEVTQGCAEVHRGVCRGVGRCMDWYVDVQRCMDRCTVVHGDVQRCTEVCTEVCGGTEVCRGAQKVTEVHRCMWRCMEGSQRCMEACIEVQGGGQRGVWRWTEGCVEVDR